MRRSLALLATLAAAAVGCGAPPAPPPEHEPTFDAAPLVEVDSASGALHVILRTDPQPPAVGLAFAEYEVLDADDVPVEHLTLTIAPYMPGMGHGTSVVPTATEAGAGVYHVKNVDLIMPGLWELRTHFAGAVLDDAAPAFDVP